MDQQKTGIRSEVLGRITTTPQLSRTLEGVAFCRFKVATDAGPMGRSLVKSIYVKGNPALAPSEDLPVRIEANLGLGDLVLVPGCERQRPRKKRGVEFIETAIEAEDVRLKERAGGRATA